MAFDVAMMVPVTLAAEITEDAADSVAWALRENAGRAVVLEIDSQGGCARSGRRICRAIRRHGDVHAEIMGSASSSAAMVWLAAQTRSMRHGARVNLHYSFVPSFAVANASAAVFQEVADELHEVDAWIRRELIDETGMSEIEAHELLLSDRWLDRAEARRLGLWGGDVE